MSKLKAVIKGAKAVAKKPVVPKVPAKQKLPASAKKVAPKKVAPKIQASKSVGKRAPAKPPVDREARQANRATVARDSYLRATGKQELNRNGLVASNAPVGKQERELVTRIRHRAQADMARKISADGTAYGVKESRSATAKRVNASRPVRAADRKAVAEINKKRADKAMKQAVVGTAAAGALAVASSRKKEK